MASDEKTPLKLPPKLKVSDMTSENHNPHPAPDDSTLKIPRASQRHSSQWTFSLSQMIKKRNKFQRLVEKNGACNILHTHLKYRRFRFLSDIYTTLIDLNWGYVLLLLSLTYLLSWSFFAIGWYVVAWSHGDLIESTFFTFGGGGGGGGDIGSYGSSHSDNTPDYVYDVPGIEITDYGGTADTLLTDGDYYNSYIRPTHSTQTGSHNTDDNSPADYGDVAKDIAVAEDLIEGASSSLSANAMARYQDPCVYNVHTLFGAFLFSIETQTTIGYGFRFISEACVYAAALEAVQNIFSYIVNTIMLGLIFAKICSPGNRVNTLKFSRHAVIAMRNGKLCFMFRVGNIRNSHLYEPHIRAYVIKPSISEEGEYVPLYHHNIDFKFASGENRTLLIWPVIICHIIDENSPFYELSARDLVEADLEVMVFLEGVVEQTGLVTQARTSYITSEIKWGHRFSSSVISLNSLKDRMYKINYQKFNSTYEVPETPEQCAKDIYRDMKKKMKAKARQIKKLQKTPTKVHANVLPKSVKQSSSLIHSLRSSPRKLQSIQEDTGNDQTPPDGQTPPDTDHNPPQPQEHQASPAPDVAESTSRSPLPEISDLSPYHDLIIQSLQELAQKVESLESALERKTSDPSPLETKTFSKDPDFPALTRQSSSPGLSASKKKNWDPKRIGLELKRRGQGSPSRLAPTETSSEEESCLVPLDDPEDAGNQPQRDSCTVS
ncbi:uncharacterized protein [Amphiura filiformis]|uniref:uncharacterized protein n=1 Tax=Amphiura filiformis TaxID=82378 RepID=UPI003B20FE2E